MTEKMEKKFCFCENDFGNFGIKNFAIANVFQTITTEHATILGVSYQDLIAKNLLWVMLKMKFEIISQPLPKQELTIITYSSKKNAMEFFRDYLIFDKNGNLLIKGMSKWCLITHDTRHIVRSVYVDLPCAENISPVFPDYPTRLRVFEPEFLPDYNYKILHDDIDINNHTNNTSYLKIIDNAISNSNRKIKLFEIDFLKETFAGQRVDVYKQTQNSDMKVLGKICEDKPCFVASIEFEN